MRIRFKSKSLADQMTSEQWKWGNISDITDVAKESIDLPLPGSLWLPLHSETKGSFIKVQNRHNPLSIDLKSRITTRLLSPQQIGIVMVINYCACNTKPTRGELSLHLLGLFECHLMCLVDTTSVGLKVIDPERLVQLWVPTSSST